MSQDLDLEDGKSRQVSKSMSQRDPAGSGVQIRRTNNSIICGSRRLLTGILIKIYGPILQMILKRKLDPSQVRVINSVFLSVSMCSMIYEILFLYTPVIDNDQMCFKFDNNLADIVFILRWSFDSAYLFYILAIPIYSKQKRWKRIFFLLVDVVTILPLPQVAVGARVVKGGDKKFRVPMFARFMSDKNFFLAMKFFLLQHVFRVIRVYTWFKKAKTTGNLAGWARYGFNLSYFHSGHVIGATWYFFAIERLTVCWRKTCKNHTGCDQLSFRCNGSSGNYTFSNEFCSTNSENTYDFGLFHDAIQSGMVEKSFLQRLFPSYRWGLQSVSSFAQGLPFSGNIWENIFVISITISSVVLFLFLIGKVQMHIQSETEKSEERRQKQRELEQWQPFEKLHEELQKRVKRQEWRETRYVNLQYLVNSLPQDLRKEVKRQLCFDLLKKVEEFSSRGNAFLEDLCDHVKPVLYTEHTYVIRERDPIDKMLFVLQGRLWSYSSRSITAGSSSTAHHNINNHLESGDFCGEEVVEWAVLQANPDSSGLPPSTTTIQALTDVEAFVLIAADLKKCITDHNQKQSSS